MPTLILQRIRGRRNSDDANTVVFSIWHWHQKPLKILKIVLNMFKTNQPTSEMIFPPECLAAFMIAPRQS